MKRFNLHIGAFLTLALAVSSCAEEELVKDSFLPTPSNTITFGASNLQIDVLSRSEKSDNSILSTTESKLVSEDGEYSLPMVVQVEEGIHRVGEEALASRASKVEVMGNINTLHAWATHTVNSSPVLYFNGETGEGFTKDGDIFYANRTEPYLWPEQGGSFDFLTVVNKPATNFTPNFNEQNQIVSFDYIVPTDAANQPDILVAKASGISDGLGDPVPLSFRHIMAAVNVKVGTLVEGTINSITFKGIDYKGTYLIENLEWINQAKEQEIVQIPVGEGYKEVLQDVNKDFTIPLRDPDEKKLINEITLMMIPQLLPNGALVQINFTDGKTGKTVNLSASIQGQEWKRNTTTNYVINIDDNYNLQITTDANIIDSHYVITQVTVYSEADSWNLSVECEEDKNADISLLLEEDVNPMAIKGFWTDKFLTKQGDQYVSTGESARGDADIENGPANVEKVVYVFIPENMSGTVRHIKLTVTTKTATKTLILEQYPVKWIDSTGSLSQVPKNGDLGCEFIIEGGLVPWGFSWTDLDEEYTTSQGNPNMLPQGQLTKIESAMKAAGIDYENFPEYLFLGQKKYNNSDTEYAGVVLLIDYEKLATAINVGSSLTDGYTNTMGMYKFEATEGEEAAGMELITALKAFVESWGDIIYKPGSGPVALASVDNYAALTALKRNRFDLYSDEANGLYIPVLNDADANWYLPAKDQYDNTISKANWGQSFTWNANYWTSSIYPNALEPDKDTGESYMFTGVTSTPADRDNGYNAMAIRKYTSQ